MKRLLVALTGAVGSGKSTALAAFRRLGAHALSTDAIAHDLTRAGGAACAAVARRFGAGVVGADGGIDRRALARRAFASARQRRALERLLHPRIMAEVRRRARRLRGVVVVEAPLLFEAGLERDFDLSLAVDAPQGLRLRRARGLGAAEARRRAAAQLPAAEKARRADLVLDNSGGLPALERGVRRLYRAFALLSGKPKGD